MATILISSISILIVCVLKVVFLAVSDLKEETVAALHALSCRHDQVCRLAAEEEVRQWERYADRFYARAAMWG